MENARKLNFLKKQKMRNPGIFFKIDSTMR